MCGSVKFNQHREKPTSVTRPGMFMFFFGVSVSIDDSWRKVVFLDVPRVKQVIIKIDPPANTTK